MRDNKLQKSGTSLQPGRTLGFSLEKFICVFLSVTLVVSGVYLGWANDLLGQLHDAIYGSDSPVAEQKTTSTSSNSQPTNSLASASTGVSSATGAASSSGSNDANDAVNFASSNATEDVVVDVKTKSKEKHTLSYYWFGLPDEDVNFYDAHGSRVFPTLPNERQVWEGDGFNVDSTYKQGFKVYTHENNSDDGETIGVYTFSGWYEFVDGVMPESDYVVSGYWFFENVDADGISKCSISYAWSGVVPASNVILKNSDGEVVTVKLPDAKSVVLGDDYTVDSVYKKGYALDAYNSANRKLGTYTFSGWDKTGTFKTTSRQVSIEGSWNYDGEEIDENPKPDNDSHTVGYAWTGAPDSTLKLSKKVELPKTEIVDDGDAHVKDSAYTEKTTIDWLGEKGEVKGTFKFSGWTKTETDIGNIVYLGSWSFLSKEAGDEDDEEETRDVPVMTNTVLYVWKNVPWSGMTLYDKSGAKINSLTLPESLELAYANSFEVDSTFKSGDEVYIHDANGRNSGKYVFSGWKLKGKEVSSAIEMGEEAIILEAEWDYVAIREVASGITGKGSVTVKTEESEKTVTNNSDGDKAPESNTTSSKEAVLVEGEAGETVSIKVAPKSGWYVAQVRYAATPTGYVYGSATPLAFFAILPNSKGEYSFIMPSNHVTIYVDFVSIVWDGTIDLTWYDKNKTTYDLKYAAQFAGLAAIVNGLFTNYPTTKQVVKAPDGVHEITVDMPDYEAFKRKMGVSGTNSERYGTFTSTYTVADSQNGNNRYSRSSKVTRTQRVIGDPSAIVSTKKEDRESGSQNLTTWSGYWFGADSFKGKTVYITSDLDFGAKRDSQGKWLTSSPLYMPVGGQYCVLPGLTQTNAYSKLSASFCGTLDGLGHEFKNVYAEYYADTNYGDSESVGLIGRLGCHDNDKATLCPTNPTVRQIVLKSGYVSGRRSIGGIVGKTGKTTSDYGKGNDGSTGAIIEMCINWASVTSSDKKGCGGIVGAAWNNGIVQYCANFGTIVSRNIQNPTGGIAGSNEKVVKNCYNVGRVIAFDTRFASGIATNNGGQSSVQNCYWLSGSATEGYHDGAKSDTCYEFGGSLKISVLTPELLNAKSDSIWVDGSGVSDHFNGKYYYPILFFQARKLES